MFFTRKRVQALLLIAGGGLGTLTVLALVVAIFVGMATPSDNNGQTATTATTTTQNGSSQTSVEPPSGNLFGTIEIGSSGIKGIVWRISPQEAKTLFSQKPGAETARYQIFAHAMLRHYDDFNTKLQDERNLPAAVEAVSDFVTSMRAANVPLANIYIVASSGVADLPQLGQIEADVETKTGIKPDVITPARECSDTFAWIVPPERTYDSAVIDMGSGNTKACYVEHGTYGDRMRGLELLPYGAKTYETKILDDKKPAESFARASARLAESTLAPLIDDAVSGNPGLETRPRVYLSGGGAWVTAMLIHPSESAQDYVPLTAPRDFLALRKEAAAGTADLVKLNDPFSQRQLVAGLDILIAISNGLGLKHRTVLFPAPARDAWMSNYLMNKLALSENAGE